MPPWFPANLAGRFEASTLISARRVIFSATIALLFQKYRARYLKLRLLISIVIEAAFVEQTSEFCLLMFLQVDQLHIFLAF